MELRVYLRILHKSWALIIATTLVGVGLAGVVSLLMAPQYQGKTQLYVSVRPESSATGDLVQGSNFARQIVASYVDIVNTSVVLDPVIEELGLDITSGELSKSISADSPLNTVLINITATSTDPKQAADIANATGDSFANVVQTTLEGDGKDAQSSIVRLTTTQPATEPIAPTSPNTKVNFAFGFLLGMALGVGSAVVRSVLDTRIHSLQDIEEITDQPLLGGIAFDPDTAERPLIVHTDPRNPRAESFRSLRTNLQFLNFGEGGHSFVLTSAGPSEGKSTTAANLAISLAETGARVVLVEGDLRLPKVATYMGIHSGAGLTDVLIGKARINDVMHRWGRGQLFVLPAGRIPPNPSELLGSRAMDSTLELLAERFEYILIDAPPVLMVTDAAVVGKKASGVIVIVASGSTKKQAFNAAVHALETAGAKVLGLVVTMLPTKGPDSYGYGQYSYGPTELSEVTNPIKPAGSKPKRAPIKARRRKA
ncbi:polysaccharide biosynthesis tyrosine autokinase [Jonesiaceae bacterium BS-20]|uniref:non-specific protein-tyrosine kinase n=1 Tax=Jonesiaceae bacterium BS-20 TaxID=3120821 RepID=A0AAU7DYP6_9MICO